MSELTKEYLIESGVHFGHPTQKWNPAFKKFIAGVNRGDWPTAAIEMMDSRWANQVGDRATRLRNRILTLDHSHQE